MKNLNLPIAALLLFFHAALIAQTAGYSNNGSVPPPLFRPVADKLIPSDLPPEMVRRRVLELDPETLSQVYAAEATVLRLALPTPDVPDGLPVILNRQSLTTANFSLLRASDGLLVPTPDLGRHYRGHLGGRPDCRVSLSLTQREVRAAINYPNGKRVVIERTRRQRKDRTTDRYLVYADREMLRARELNCEASDAGPGYTKGELATPGGKSAVGGCVEVYFEVDDDIFQDFGGVTEAAAFVLGSANEMAALYADIDVNLRVSQIKVWDVPSPYSGTSAGVMLGQFGRQTRTFDGDVAQLLSYRASGGIAYIDGLCHPSRAARMSFASIDGGYRAVPFYSWTVMVMAHELGHQLGSRHTHACVWNGDNTAIDNCAGFTEYGCAANGIPQGGGNVMSYCHVNAVGIDFVKGLRGQPGDLIANRVARAQDCLNHDCAAGGGGGPAGPPVSGDGDGSGGDRPGRECENVTIRIVVDNFGGETTWALNAENGEVAASGGPYANGVSGRIYETAACLPPGCYELTVEDLHGDGMCCRFGAGGFQLTGDGGTVYASGGAFRYERVVDFCVEGTPPGGNDEDKNGEEEPEDPPASECQTIDFGTLRPTGFGTNQDGGRVRIIENGAGIYLENNAWKAIDLDYELTPHTQLNFWFRSTRQGEVHGIGFDGNQIISASQTFRLYGTQAWGVNDFADYPGDGQWAYYSIPVGAYHTGPVHYLFFAADQDVGSKNGNSFFRDVVITEGNDCGEGAPLRARAPASGKIRAYPNPTSDRIRLELPGAGGEYRLGDMMGRRLRSGRSAGAVLELALGDLPVGTYLFEYHSPAGRALKKISVVR